MARRADLEAAYAAQQAALVSWLRALPSAAAERPSRLAGWTVQQLAFHTTEVPRALTRALASEPPSERPLSIAGYTAKWRDSAAQIEQRDRAGADGLSLADLAALHEQQGAAMLAALGAAEADRVVAARRGPIRVTDLLSTRVNELVVHSLDLSASVPQVAPVELDKQALGVSCRMLAAILAERVPGRTVELRVPPYAAVQCVEGPRHTRGTPANVVEVAPVTWVELATGRLSWTEAWLPGDCRSAASAPTSPRHLPVLSA